MRILSLIRLKMAMHLTTLISYWYKRKGHEIVYQTTLCAFHGDDANPICNYPLGSRLFQYATNDHSIPTSCFQLSRSIISWQIWRKNISIIDIWLEREREWDDISMELFWFKIEIFASLLIDTSILKKRRLNVALSHNLSTGYLFNCNDNWLNITWYKL